MPPEHVQMKLNLAGYASYRDVAAALRKQPNYTHARSLDIEQRYVASIVNRWANREDCTRPPQGKSLQVLFFVSRAIGEPVTPIIAPIINAAQGVTRHAA